MNNNKLLSASINWRRRSLEDWYTIGEPPEREVMPDFSIDIKGKEMSVRVAWTREQLLVAFSLYCQMPFGKMHSRNPEIVKYANFIGRTPSAMAMKLTNIASLDPAITSTGRSGLKAASAADKEMWEEMSQDWGKFAYEAQSAIDALGKTDESGSAYAEESTEDEAIDYSGSHKEVKTLARVGQDFFRRSVLSAYNYRCCISGLAIPQLLVASHIVPWRVDTSNRVNPKNGLCLSSIHDKAFDIGLITVTDEMVLKVATQYRHSTDTFFAISIGAHDGKPIALPEKFRPLDGFFSYHRQHIFKG